MYVQCFSWLEFQLDINILLVFPLLVSNILLTCCCCTTAGSLSSLRLMNPAKLVPWAVTLASHLELSSYVLDES